MYVAIDANIELSEEDGVMDVFGYVKKMRTQRRGLVESLVSRTTIIVVRLEISQSSSGTSGLQSGLFPKMKKKHVSPKGR